MRFRRYLQIWKDALREKQRSPYMVHELPGHSVRVCDNLLRAELVISLWCL